MIDFKYSLKSELDNSKRKYFKAYIEGDFQIIIDRKLFFDEEDFLLVEFVSEIKRWLERYKLNKEDFIYNSMDVDEEPIIIFKITQNGFIISSLWQNFTSNVILQELELILKIEEFVKNVEKDVLNKYNLIF
jgi:hypothetical protein